MEKYTEFKEHVPLDQPIIKNETHKHKPDDSVHIDSITHSLLEVQQQQNYRLHELVLRQQESALALTLPQPEVPTFTGNPMEYWKFIRAFENLIENKTSSHSARLYYLVQYTSGEVKELVRSCLARREDVGYLEAKNLLKKRYGQSYRIANAFVEKLAKGPAIKAEDGDALRRFSNLLSSCRNTLKEIAIVGRLPYGLRQRWRDVADDITENQEREITVEDLNRFVAAKARAANHAVFGDISVQQQPTTPGNARARLKQTPRNTSTLATNTYSEASSEPPNTHQNQNRHRCPMCDSNHWLSQCIDFKRKSVKERIAFACLKGLCDNCLVYGHRASACPKPRFCRITGCYGNHSSFLHPRSVEQAPSPSSAHQLSTNSPPQAPASVSEATSSYVQGKKRLVQKDNLGPPTATGLAVVPVKVRSPDRNEAVTTYAFLDTGSTASFCSEELANQLGLSGRETLLSLTTMEKEDSKVKSSMVSLEVSDLEDEVLIKIPMVFTRSKLPVSVDNAAAQEDIDRWPHLRGIEIAKIDAKVGLLIGCDAPEALAPKDIIPSCNGGPYAARTIFGWVINGPLGRSQSSVTRASHFIKTGVELEELFRDYCDMEFNDAIYRNKPAMSQEDKQALRIFSETAKLEKGHYEVALPWKTDPSQLENNKIVAQRRLALLKKPLLVDKELCKKYCDCVDDLLQKGYAKRAPSYDVPGKTWYLPHHAVFHPAKPGKVRVVFDCSAKYRGSSLNDCSALRFLLWPDGDLDSESEEQMMTVHLFGRVSSPSCANFALRKTAEDNKALFDPQIIHTVKRNFYVDDCLKSVNSDHDAINLFKDLTELLKTGGFRLTKWLSNSRQVMELIPESERAKSVKNLDFGHAPIERALGVQWCISSDTFGFSIAIKDRPATRRGILSVVSSVYDPLGFIAPFILPAKIPLQDLCKKKLDWDEKIPEEDLSRWKAWLKELPKLQGFFRLVDVSNPVDSVKLLQLSYITSLTPQKSLMELFLTSGWSTPTVMYIVCISLANPDYPH